MKNKTKLDAFEQDIEDNAGQFVPLSSSEQHTITSLIEKAKKNTSISLRISTYDLAKLKQKAHQHGLPYQTLITTVLHRYINNDFFEKNEVLKTFNALKSAH